MCTALHPIYIHRLFRSQMSLSNHIANSTRYERLKAVHAHDAISQHLSIHSTTRCVAIHHDCLRASTDPRPTSMAMGFVRCGRLPGRAGAANSHDTLAPRMWTAAPAQRRRRQCPASRDFKSRSVAVAVPSRLVASSAGSTAKSTACKCDDGDSSCNACSAIPATAAGTAAPGS